MAMSVRKGYRSWWKGCVWGVGAFFRVENSGCGLLKLGFLENVEAGGDLGVKLTCIFEQNTVANVDIALPTPLVVDFPQMPIAFCYGTCNSAWGCCLTVGVGSSSPERPGVTLPQW